MECKFIAMSERQIRLDGVSLVCIETRRPQLAMMALKRCMRRIDFRECLLLGSKAGSAHMSDSIEHVAIPPIANVAEYSRFMVRNFGNYFSGSHALLVQWDGFIIHPECWDDRFLEYDYIGAPWHALGNVVGNGGFSLRSKRLVKALQQLDMPETHPEDYQICVRHRNELESRFGIRFAPPEIAIRFSWEAVEPTQPSFGFHGFFNFHRVMSDTELIDYFDLCDDSMLHTIEARRLLKNLYRASMLEAASRLHARRMNGPLSMRLDAWKLRILGSLSRRAHAH
jgi:Protein of unknown function (DUF5672)